MIRFLRFFVVFFSVFVAGLPVLASQNTSSQPPSYISSGGGTSQCPSFNSVIMTVVYCVQMAVVSGTLIMLPETSSLMWPITMAAITLVVSLFGYRLSVGETELNRKTMGLLLKIGVVMMFGFNFGGGLFGGPGWTLETFGATTTLQDAVVKSLWSTVWSGGSQNCPAGGFAAGAPSYSYIAASGVNVWASIDCILGKLFGFGGSFLMASSIFGMLGSILGSGTIGVMAFFFGLTTLLTIMFFALRCVYIFLVSYVFIGFLIVISPFVMPTLMFRTTQFMFDAWLKNLVSALLIPAALFTYLCLILPLLDSVVMGNDPDSLQSAVSDTEVQNAYRNLQQQCAMPGLSTDFAWYNQLAGSMNIQNWTQSGPMRHPTTPSMSAAADACQNMQMTSLDFGNNHVMKLWEIAYALMQVFLVGVLVTMVMNMIPTLVSGWTGGWTAARAAESPVPGQQQLGALVNRAQSGMMGRVSSRTGMLGGLSSLVTRR